LKPHVLEAKEKLGEIHVIGRYEAILHRIAPVHFAITDREGKNEIVVEFLKKELVIFELTPGVMTNSPSYDWHLMNLRNYLYVKGPDDWPPIHALGVDIPQIGFGYGSGLLGLPGDYTPPSRFVRAFFYKRFSRRTDGGEDTVREAIRILQNFQLPVEKTEAEFQEPDSEWETLKYGSTQWTCAYDLKNLKMYYHTAKNPSIRVVNFKTVDFKNMPKEKRPLFKLDKEEDKYVVADVTPKDVSPARIGKKRLY
jgi:choloylglycine hydrolase